MIGITSHDSAKVINISMFGGKPDTGEDMGMAVRAALSAASQEEGVVILEFNKGRYDFYHETGTKVPYYISNTTSEEECEGIIKNIGIYIKDMKDIVIEGNDSLFIFHGKMTTIVIDKSENVEIQNVSIDFERPTMSEVTVEGVGENYIDFKVNEDSWYEIEKDKLTWVGEGFRYTGGPSQEYSPVTNTTWRNWNPVFDAEWVIEIEPFKVRAYYSKMHPTKVGNIFQMRDGIRDQVGAFIHKSKGISFKNTKFHYMHGLGIVGQYSEDLYFEKISCSPREVTGRTNTGFADFMQLSGCKGKIKVINSKFIGAQDDPINIHGTHLKIMEKRSDNEIIVRFMHPQTYGIDAFFLGDKIDFINASTLTVRGSAYIQSVEKLDPRKVVLVLDREVPKEVEIGDAVENATWTPEVEIRGNYFSRIPTRGILVSTRQRVIIEDNIFERMGMSGVLIGDDAQSWYESGMVSDVTIKNNTFIECGQPVINIAPENTGMNIEDPVHRNICIKENKFIINHERVMYAKSTKGIQFKDNIIQWGEGIKDKGLQPKVELLVCSDIEILDDLVAVEVHN